MTGSILKQLLAAILLVRTAVLHPVLRAGALAVALLPVLVMTSMIGVGTVLADPPVEPTDPCTIDNTQFGCPGYDPCAGITGPWSTTLSLSGPGSVSWGTGPTFSASASTTHACAPGASGGSITISYSAVPGSGNGSGSGVIPGAGGSYTFPPFLNAGTYNVTASYSGSGDVSGSTASTTVTIEKAVTRTEITFAPDQDLFQPGDSLTMTVRVFRDPNPNPPGGLPQGVVKFDLFGQNSYHVLLPASGVITMTRPIPATIGTFDGRATFIPFTENAGTWASIPANITHPGLSWIGNDQGSSAVRRVSIGVVSPSMTLTATPSSAAIGAPVTLRAALSPETINDPLTVDFYVDGVLLGSSPTTDRVATLTTSDIPAGVQTVTAVFEGNFAYGIARAETTVTITGIQTTTTIGASPTTVAPGGSTTLTANITPQQPGGVAVGGTVEFVEGDVVVGTGAVSNGVATAVVSSLAEGMHYYRARYLGDGMYAASTSAGTAGVNVGRKSTTTSITPTSQTVPAGGTVTFNVSVLPGPGDAVPSGTVTLQSDTQVLGTFNLVNGSTTQSFNLPNGLHLVRATYSGDADQLPSTSAAATAAVGTTASSVSLQLIPAVPTLSDSISLRASVIGSGTPVGQIRLSGHGIGLTQTLSAGQTTFAIGVLPIGSYEFLVEYLGQGVNDPSSRSISFTIAKRQSTTSISAPEGLIPPGGSLPVSISVTGVGSSTTPTGNVTLYRDGSVPVATLPLSGNVAEYTFTNLQAGALTLHARYEGDSAYDASESSTISRSVGRVATQLVLLKSADPAPVGSAATITATLSHFDTSGAQPSGSIVFLFNGGLQQTVPLVDGKAVAALSSLPIGQYDVTASYAGDSRFANATAQAVQTIGKSTASIAVGQSATTSIVGDTVTFDAVLTPNAPQTAVPTGEVAFLIGDRRIAATLSNGAVSIDVDDLAAGSYPVRVEYAGDAVFESGVSAAVGHIVRKIPTTTSLTSTSNPSGAQETFSIIATVSSDDGIPSGDVMFQRGGQTIGTVALDASGLASFDWSEAAPGTYDYTARYVGSASHADSVSPVLHQVVGQASAALVLDVPADPIRAGTQIDIVATVSATPPATGTPSGTVLFSLDDGASVSVALEDGVATWRTPVLHSGPRTFRAVYEGSGPYSTATDTKVRDVVAVGTTTTVAATPNPSIVNAPVELIGRVSSDFGVPTGTISFLADGVEIGSASPANGEARFVWTPSTPGTRQITANYGGSTIHAGSTSSAVVHVVNTASGKGEVSLLATGPFSVAANATAQIDVSIAPMPPATGTPSGQYSLLVDGVELVTQAVSGSTASLTTPPLASGTRSIVVRYSGDASFEPKSSNLILVQVASSTATVSTTTSVSANPNPAEVGTEVLLTANVVPSAGLVAGGSVSFRIDGAVVGSAPVVSGVAVLPWTPGAVGSYSIIVSYSGDGTYLPSTSLSTSLQVVDDIGGRIASNIVATPSSVAVPAGQAATIAIEVQSTGVGTDRPTGNVSVRFDGGAATVLGLVDGQTSYTTPALALGDHVIEIAYDGDALFLPSMASVSASALVDSGPVATSTSLMVSSASPVVGQQMTLTATVLPVSGAPVNDGIVTFLLDGSPIGQGAVASGSATYAFTPLDLGAAELIAVYSGVEDEHLGSTSQPVQIVVTEDVPPKIATTTVLSSTSTLYGIGETATISISVLPASGSVQPGGSADVIFDGAAPFRIDIVDGAASWTTPALAEGQHTVIVIYAGDDAFFGSSSTAFMVEASASTDDVATTTQVFAAPYPGVAGQQSTFSATIVAADASDVSFGSVDFRVDGTSIGVALVSNGAASVPWTPSVADTFDVQAFYTGSAGRFAGSSSPLSEYLVEGSATEKTATITTATAARTQVGIGETVEISIEVASVSPATSVPSGDATVVIDGLAPVQVPLTNGGATWTTPALADGTHQVLVSYAGDTVHASSSAAAIAIIASAGTGESPTTTSVMAIPFPGIVGQETTFTATISAENGATVVGGTATFSRDEVDFATAPVVNGIATATWTPDSVDTHTIRVTYSGVVGSFAASISPLGSYPVEAGSVSDAPTTTTFTILPSTGRVGEASTATISVVADGAIVSGGTATLMANGMPVGQASVEQGSAVVPWTPDQSGAFELVAVYSGSVGSYLGSTSSPRDYIVEDALPVAIVTTTSIAATPYPGNVGQETTFTATVSAAAIVDGGTVAFARDGILLETVAVANGTATTRWTPTQSGSSTITADYSGVPNAFLPSSAVPGAYPVNDVVVDKIGTSTIATASASAVQAGQSVNVAISVVPTSASTDIPTGSAVVFLDGVASGTVLLVDGAGTWTSPALAAGTHAIVVSYEGDDAFFASSSAAIDVTASTTPVEIQTSTALALSPATGVVGQATSLVASVSAVNGVVLQAGGVRFLVDGVLVGTSVVENGVASISWSPTAARPHDVQAIFEGVSGSFAGSASVVRQYVVDAPSADKATTITTASTDRSSFAVGEVATISIEVVRANGTAGTPSGNALVVVDGNSAVPVALTNGRATWTTPVLSAGSHVVGVSYAGDAAHLQSAAAPIVLVVADVPQAASTATSLLISPATGTIGAPTTLTAQVSANGSLVQSGTIGFFVDGVLIGSTPIANGVASIAWTPAAAGDHVVRAAYAGSAGVYLPSEAVRSYVVNPLSGSLYETTTDLRLAVNPAPAGQSIPIVAQIGTTGGVLTGMVEFTANGAVIGSASVGSNGLASIAWTTPSTAQSISIGARFLATTTHAASSEVETLVVQGTGSMLRPTTMQILIEPNPATVGDRATIRVDVLPISPDTVIPTGTVTLSMGAMGSVQGQLVGGSVAFQSPVLTAGSYAISAAYSGDAIYASNAANGGVLDVVAGTGKDATSTMLTIQPSSIDLGASTTLEATVSSVGGGSPSGTVEFRSGATIIGTGTLSGNRASLVWTPSAAGYHAVSARYVGDATHDASLSASSALVVRQPGATLLGSAVAISVQPANPYAGQAVVIRAAVSAVAPAVGTPTGQVSIVLDGGATSVPLVNGVAVFASPALSAGAHTVSVEYSGDGVFGPSSGQRQITVLSPGMRVTESTLTASANPAAIGQTVAYDLHVTAADGSTPDGAAILVIDGVDQETVTLVNGRATWTRQFSATGLHEVGVLYLGTTGYGPSASNVIQQTVNEQVVPGSITIRQVAGRRDAVFSFSSDAPGLTGSISTQGGRGQIGPVAVQPGTYTILARDPSEAGYVISMISCTDDDGSVDVLSRRATVNLGPGENVVCTFSSIDATTETVDSIQNFLDARADILIANLPGIDRRIDRLQGTMSGAPFSPGAMLMGYSSAFDGAPMRFSSSLSAIDSVAGYQQPNQFDVWVEGAVGTVQRGGIGDGLYGVVSVGADYRLGDDMLVGVMGQYDRMNLDQQSGARTAGNGWLVGPYMTMRIGDGLYLDLMAAAGASSNEISPFGTYTDEFHTRRYVLNATLQGDWDMGDWTFSPRAKATYFDETSESYQDSRGIRIPEVSTKKGSLSIGPGASYAFSLDALELEVGARAEVAADIDGSNGSVGVSNARGRLEGMLDIGLPGGANVDLTLTYDGLGSSNTSIGARAGLLVPLN